MMFDKGYTRISQDQARELMASASGFALVDVRSPAEFASRRIPGAVNLPLDALQAQAPKVLPDPSQPIITYCLSGMRSKMAARTLVGMGYTNVYEMGGIDTWTGATTGSGGGGGSR